MAPVDGGPGAPQHPLEPSPRTDGVRGRPPLLAAAAVLVLLEVAALVAAAVAGGAALVRGSDPGQVLFLVLLSLGVAALLAGAVRALWSGRRWGRGPVLTAQIMVVVTAATWWGSGGGLRALGPLVVALVVASALLTPRVVAATAGRGSA